MCPIHLAVKPATVHVGDFRPSGSRSTQVSRGFVRDQNRRGPIAHTVQQIAAREMEIVRIEGALQRAEELSDDVAAAIERAS